jgi:hypothetical protein
VGSVSRPRFSWYRYERAATPRPWFPTSGTSGTPARPELTELNVWSGHVGHHQVEERSVFEEPAQRGECRLRERFEDPEVGELSRARDHDPSVWLSKEGRYRPRSQVEGEVPP